MWKGGGGGWSINQNTTINGLNHCSLVWPQRYYWQSTPLPLRGGGEQFGAGKSAHWRLSIRISSMNSYLASLGWISVKGRKKGVCVCVRVGPSRLREPGGWSLWPLWPGAMNVRWARGLWQGSTAGLLSPGISSICLPPNAAPSLLLSIS